MSSFDWYLVRVVDFERSDTLTVDYDIERATTDFHSDPFMRQLERCRHRELRDELGRIGALPVGGSSKCCAGQGSVVASRRCRE